MGLQGVRYDQEHTHTHTRTHTHAFRKIIVIQLTIKNSHRKIMIKLTKQKINYQKPLCIKNHISKIISKKTVFIGPITKRTEIHHT